MSWNPSYAILILISTVITYLSGVYLGKVDSLPLSDEVKKRRKKLYVSISFSSNLLILFFFKYFNFFNESFVEVAQLLGIEVHGSRFNVLLPVGISFYTFQALSYTMDVFRGKILPEKHFGRYALFVSFFPQLVAGPIERSTNLLPQFRQHKKFDHNRIREGLLLMMWGFFQKVVIADRLAVLVDTVYNDPESFKGVQLGLATVFFAFQILCDFSGYSDIAIGASKVLGFDLMKNFERPYFSKSIKEFWRRWHISLSTWFRDYLYFPLGGNRGSKLYVYRNLMIVFLVSGLWHGANWTFVVWGALHGSYLVIEDYMNGIWIKYRFTIMNNKGFSSKILKVALNFMLVTFAWIFFRSNTLSDSFYIVKNLLVNNFSKLFGNELYTMGLDKQDFSIAVISVLFLLLIHGLQRKTSLSKWVFNQWMPIRWSIYIGMALIILIFGYYGEQKEAQFIYFQF
ncbi:MBOAT family O-acyltransferase [Flagellimonas aequoris]|nr:MBOAT family O-acyltransferase [Allomuricauda aequoris]